jgi:hypothetical protein
VSKDDKLFFSENEVVAYLEDMIQMGMATSNEMELYEDYLYDGKMKKLNNTYKQVIFRMRDEWESEF